MIMNYILQPIIDPDIKQIKYDINGNSNHDLIAYIYIRFAHDLINFPIQGKRRINLESIKKAEKLNKRMQKYEIKSDFNSNFFIDIYRKSPVPESNYNNNVSEYLTNLFQSKKFIEIINKTYDYNVYKWAENYRNKENFFPFRHEYGLLALAKTIKHISLDKNTILELDVKDIFKE